MKYENGIHQTRKKQSTYNKESGANMSSCTCSVYVYPRPDPKDVSIDVDSDLKIEVERNKSTDGRKTGTCNVTYLPISGISAKIPFESWDNRIVEISKESAIQRLKDKLYQLEYEKEETIYWNRDEKIRSYNPDKQIVTDHRLESVGEKVSSIEQFLKGDCGHDIVTNFSNELEEFYALESLMNFRDEIIVERKRQKNDNTSKNKKSSKSIKINKYASKKKSYKEKE